ncbi:MAG TPA: polysaccharide biosynthesis tyrosine autokinase [Terriglobales bacterium]|jgi:exopolysaccharide transport family protein|nr:polysaccharide biosynthesis tyrosine autokinase [Terriglobales bacterium]
MDSGPLIPANGQVLREVQPAYPIEFTRSPHVYPALLVQDSVLREYLRILIKRKWVVLSSVALIFSVLAIATLRSTPIYEASGSIAINKPDPEIMNLKDSPNGGDYYYDPADLDTEASILRSDLLALQIIKQLSLDKQPEFGGRGEPPANSLGLATDALQLDSSRTSELLAAFKANLHVALRPDTRIIEIRYRSPDKNLAARVVNTLISTYIEQNFKTRFESTMQTSDWLQKQLADLQIKVETSQEKLVKYQKEHEILGIDEKQNIITSKLDELNKELTAAESDRMEKESVYRMVQSGDADTAAAAAAADAEAGNGASSGSSLLEKLREQKADLKIQVAQLSTQFGPSYPKVAQLNNQLKEVDTQIQLEMKKVVSGVRGNYLAALQRENMLSDALERQKQDANQLNESAIDYSLLKRDVETNRTLYEGLLEKLKEAGVTAGLRSNNIRPVDRARVPTGPTEPNVPRNLSFALALGLSTGIGLAFLLDGLDNTVRTPEQAQVISALASLGIIPLGSKTTEAGSQQKLAVASSKEAVELVTQSRPQSQMAESYRALRTSLLLASLGAPPKVILITSALPQEGKTTTSINTAIVLAQKGTRVLLVDADLRRPSIHKTLGMGPKIGLSNVLTGNASIQQATVRSSLLPSLFVLPAGTPPPNPAELLASTNMKDVLAALCEEYDHIVVDTPPTLSVTDAVVMSTRADAVVLVIRSGQTTKQALRRARDLLMQVNARVCGVLLNAVDLRSPEYYYYYEYQGKYGQRYYHEDVLTGVEEPAPKATSSGA